MIVTLLALAHRARTGHRPWPDEMIGPGWRGWAWFCDCGAQWWPLGAPDGGRHIKRERPTR